MKLPFINAAALALLCPLVSGQEIKLLPNDGAAGDEFGFSVAISDTTSIVGAPNDDDNGVDSGSAYLFDTTSGTQIAKLLPSDGGEWDLFGWSVAISGNIAIVGAWGDEDSGNDAGAAYLFDISNPSVPLEIAKLHAGDGALHDQFGRSVAIDGNTAIVGAWKNDINGSDSGSAYLFDANTGAQLFILLRDDGASDDHFGNSVAISGTTAIVGAWEDDDNGSSSGSAYLFDTTTGTQIAKLLASDGADDDRFGVSVAIDGNLAVIGASQTHQGSWWTFGPGKAYAFDAVSGNELTTFTADYGSPGEQFGHSVSISAEKVLICAWRNGLLGGAWTGCAYTFDAATGAQIDQFAPSGPGSVASGYGHSLAISGDTAIMGAPGDDEGGDFAGAAYLRDLTHCQTFAPGRLITDQAQDVHEIYAADLDNDGDIDVLSASIADDKIAWYENDGTGQFGVQNVITTDADGAHSVFAADLNGDGYLDVLSASTIDHKLAWYENDGSGGFGPQQIIIETAQTPHSVSASDVNGDGDIDVLCANWTTNSIECHINDGLGNFGPPELLSEGAPVIGAVSVHAFKQGQTSVIQGQVLSAGRWDDSIQLHIRWYLGSFGVFWISIPITANADEVNTVFAADIDGDGDKDVLSASSGDDKIAWFENPDDWSSVWNEHVITTNAIDAYSVFAADFDSDGDVDVVSVSEGDDKIAWYENEGDGTFTQEHVITTSANTARSVHAIDLNGDGHLDIIAASAADNSVVWYENLTKTDCDGDGIDDVYEILNDPGLDCDENSVLDACELSAGVGDCNGNGLFDTCEIQGGAVEDCNDNGVPDSCERDHDCNADGIPDECQGWGDCDGDGIWDVCEIAGGTSTDCDNDGVPDDCQMSGGKGDCNLSGVLDVCEIQDGILPDCNANWIPDNCEGLPDCNSDGIPDECEPDCNNNTIPDPCEGLPDCNEDGVLDECQSLNDCDGDGTPDACEIAAGTDSDLNGNSLPDSCECFTTNYCTLSPNSVGPGVQISASGIPSIGLNILGIDATGGPSNQPGLYFHGAGTASQPFGEGLRCVSTPILRVGPPVFFNGAGNASKQLDMNATALNGIQPADTRYFQLWYRDSAGGPWGYNLSDGLEITFCP